MLNALETFIADSVALGKLKEDYLLHFRSDYTEGWTSPGKNVIDIVKNWPCYSLP